MYKKLDKYAKAAVAGMFIAGATLQVNADAHTGSILPVEKALYETARSDYDSSSKRDLNVENSVRSDLYPLLYDQQLGPYIVAVFRDIEFGNFDGAENILRITYGKAKIEHNDFAINRIGVAYAYMTGKREQQGIQHVPEYNHARSTSSVNKNGEGVISAEENYILMEKTVQQMMQPLMDEPPLRPLIVNILTDIRVGDFREAFGSLRAVKKEARGKEHGVAIKEADLVHSYIMMAEPQLSIQYYGNLFNKRIAERISAMFIAKSERTYELSNGSY
jgi:hypothetical protein